METPTKIVYENYCRICSSRKITSKLLVVVTKDGGKNEIGRKLKKYCKIDITEGHGSRHICVNCKHKLDVIVSKVNDLKAQWKKSEETTSQQQTNCRVKRMLSTNDSREGAVKARLETNDPNQVSVIKYLSTLTGRSLLKPCSLFFLW